MHSHRRGSDGIGRGLLAPLRRVLAAAFAAGASLVLAACGTSEGFVERLDRPTALTIVTADEPLVFARTESRYSWSQRDYVYLGPVETNAQGVREYFLWVGVASTLDRGFIAPESAPPRAVQVRLRDEWIELPLEPWSDRVRGVDGRSLYRSSARTGAELAARVTVDQLRLVEEEHLASLVMVSAGGEAREFVRWRAGADDAGLSAFLARLSAVE